MSGRYQCLQLKHVVLQATLAIACTGTGQITLAKNIDAGSGLSVSQEQDSANVARKADVIRLHIVDQRRDGVSQASVALSIIEVDKQEKSLRPNNVSLQTDANGVIELPINNYARVHVVGMQCEGYLSLIQKQYRPSDLAWYAKDNKTYLDESCTREISAISLVMWKIDGELPSLLSTIDHSTLERDRDSVVIPLINDLGYAVALHLSLIGTNRDQPKGARGCVARVVADDGELCIVQERLVVQMPVDGYKNEELLEAVQIKSGESIIKNRLFIRWTNDKKPRGGLLDIELLPDVHGKLRVRVAGLFNLAETSSLVTIDEKYYSTIPELVRGRHGPVDVIIPTKEPLPERGNDEKMRPKEDAKRPEAPIVIKVRDQDDRSVSRKTLQVKANISRNNRPETATFEKMQATLDDNGAFTIVGRASGKIEIAGIEDEELYLSRAVIDAAKQGEDPIVLSAWRWRKHPTVTFSTAAIRGRPDEWLSAEIRLPAGSDDGGQKATVKARIRREKATDQFTPFAWSAELRIEGLEFAESKLVPGCLASGGDYRDQLLITMSKDGTEWQPFVKNRWFVRSTTRKYYGALTVQISAFESGGVSSQLWLNMSEAGNEEVLPIDDVRVARGIVR